MPFHGILAGALFGVLDMLHERDPDFVAIRAAAKHKRKALLLERHPDRGGSPDDTKSINQAWSDLQTLLDEWQQARQLQTPGVRITVKASRK